MTKKLVLSDDDVLALRYVLRLVLEFDVTPLDHKGLLALIMKRLDDL